MVEYSECVKKLAFQLLNKIVSITSYDTKSKDGSINFKPLASWFFKDLRCSEEEFVLCLDFLKRFHLYFYQKLDIPPCWDGKAYAKFPQLFINGESVRLEALKEIPSFPDIDGTNHPSYKKGDVFTVAQKVALSFIKHGVAKPNEG